MGQSADDIVKNRPRVLIFSLAYFPLVGGAEIALKEITDRLGDVFDFDLITLRFNKEWPREEKMGQIRVFRLKKGFILPKLIFPLKAAILAQRLHSRQPYRLVWPIMAAYAGWAGLFFKFLYPKVPMLLTLQEGDSESHILKRVGVFYPLWRLIFKKADYIQAISNYLAGFAKRHGAVCPIEIVPNGVNLKNFQFPIPNFQSNPKSQISSKFQVPSSKIIITTSRLVYKNGIDVLIRAGAILKTMIPDSRFLIRILGGGPEESNLKKLARDLDVADIIEFAGHVPPDLIPQYLAQADIFVRPSRSEGLGSSFLEAMVAGLPVIGTAVGGIPDFLKDGETGLFCRVNDPKDLADKITAVFEDAELFQRLSENGKKLVEEKYSWNQVVSQMNRIFKLLTTHYSLSTKRILLATGIYPPEIGGPATYAALLEKELPKRGIDVTVLPFRIVRDWPVGIRHFLYFLKSLRLGLKHDLILAQDTISVGLPAMLAAKLSGRKFIIRVPGDYVWEQSVQRFGVKDSIDEFQKKRYGRKIEFLRSVQKFVVNQADVVITPSNYFRDLVRGWVKDKDKVVTIYNGVEISNLKSQISNLNQIPSSKIIVSAGRLVPWKGFGMVIEMMRDLPDWKLIIIGDGPEYANLKSQISNLKLEDRVELVGSVPRDELFDYMRRAEVFVLNTHFESFSFQIVEAMSLGLPVITTKIGNLGEIISNGVDGFLVMPDDKHGFVELVKRLDQDNNLRLAISKNARVKSRVFDLENTLFELEKALRT